METELVMKTLSTKKIPVSDNFTAGFHQTFKERIPILKVLKTVERECSQISSMRPTSLILKPEHKCKNPQQNTG